MDRRRPLLLIALRAAAATSALLAFPMAHVLAEVRELPVPAMTIYPADIITAKVLSDRKFKVTAASIAGFATNRSDLVGKQARRRLAAGRPVPLSALMVPFAVKRGATVQASYQDSGFVISSTLIALQDGSGGDVIDARNAATGIIVRAAVQTDGSLLVGGP